MSETNDDVSGASHVASFPEWYLRWSRLASVQVNVLHLLDDAKWLVEIDRARMAEWEQLGRADRSGGAAQLPRMRRKMHEMHATGNGMLDAIVPPSSVGIALRQAASWLESRNETWNSQSGRRNVAAAVYAHLHVRPASTGKGLASQVTTRGSASRLRRLCR